MLNTLEPFTVFCIGQSTPKEGMSLKMALI